MKEFIKLIVGIMATGAIVGFISDPEFNNQFNNSQSSSGWVVVACFFMFVACLVFYQKYKETGIADKPIKLILAVCCIGLLSGCSPSGMENDEVIKESKKCTDAGFDVNVVRYLGSGVILRIECLPKNYQGDIR